ncbi:hypothetical protein GGR56DRAFT_693272 [Xylariaceae sp. FL0804]|nr:hypothetical protein GGR56DRAFT_693272 [Xylariaceae sp. FL0804]
MSEQHRRHHSGHRQHRSSRQAHSGSVSRHGGSSSSRSRRSNGQLRENTSVATTTLATTPAITTVVTYAPSGDSDTIEADHCVGGRDANSSDYGHQPWDSSPDVDVHGGIALAAYAIPAPPQETWDTDVAASAAAYSGGGSYRYAPDHDIFPSYYSSAATAAGAYGADGRATSATTNIQSPRHYFHPDAVKPAALFQAWGRQYSMTTTPTTTTNLPAFCPDERRFPGTLAGQQDQSDGRAPGRWASSRSASPASVQVGQGSDLGDSSFLGQQEGQQQQQPDHYSTSTTTRPFPTGGPPHRGGERNDVLEEYVRDVDGPWVWAAEDAEGPRRLERRRHRIDRVVQDQQQQYSSTAARSRRRR